LTFREPVPANEGNSWSAWMSHLRRSLEEEDALPRRFLRRSVAQKLREQGIESEPLLGALTDHILSGSDEPFKWEAIDGAPTGDVQITFTKEDGDRIVALLNVFLAEGLRRLSKAP